MNNGKLPASFAAAGFVTPDRLRPRRRIMIGTEGLSDTGKSEFILSCPGPGMVICLDRGIDKVIDNPHPPESRREDFAFKTIQVPGAGQEAGPAAYMTYWKAFYDVYLSAVNNTECVTIGIDGDSDSWELQRLAAFGKLSQVPPIKYTEVNAARRVMYARAYDACKIVVATNKLKPEYVDSEGTGTREWKGNYVRQGFGDQDYLFSIQLRHLYRGPRESKVKPGEVIPGAFGIKILKCGPNSELIGEELWGADCSFRGLVELVYPHVEPTEWGLE